MYKEILYWSIAIVLTLGIAYASLPAGVVTMLVSIIIRILLIKEEDRCRKRGH